MARVFSTPGVYKREIDLSEILVPTGISNGGIVVKAKKGPINRPVLISNDKEYIDTFGQPIFTSGFSQTSEIDKLTPEYGYGAYGALEFLKESSTLYVVRGFTSSDLYANVMINDTASTLNQVYSAGGISAAQFVAGTRLDANNYIRAINDNSNTGTGINYLTIAALGPGTDGNSVAVVIEPFSPSADWRYSYDEYPVNAADITSSAIPAASLSAYPIASNVFKVNVYTKPTTMTAWNGLYRNAADQAISALYIKPVETFYCSLQENLVDANQNNLFIETVINGNSKYIYAKNGLSNTTAFPTISGAGDTNFTSFYPYGLSGTDEYVLFGRLFDLRGGASPLTATDDVTTDWAIFQDRENVNVQILIGLSDNTATKQEMGRIAATRADCIATVQVGNLTADQTSDVISQESYGYRTPSYVAIYGGYSKIYDQYNDKFVYIPNSCLGAALFARVDNIANPWDAPAGINRAVLSVLDQRKIFVDNEIGKLYDKNINVPKFIRGTGHVMWGQKTAQLKASALDRINVRRNLLYIENNIERSLLPFVFENNTAKTRLRVFSLVDEFLAGVQAGGGLTAYQVVVDETNNTAAVIDANRMNVDIYVQPARTIEFIQLTTVITRTGISFEEVRLATA